eukprot:CAMPEP_0113581834 /NCGR_PEP_ID=MMETSP0015_2-20120614/31545_1 /TAXON_ID=2838 /ORGANISM="Odontella" /LENGTH=73 /DNA_ID=CAMNT_0000486371 /DNA_START=81 /DNA_END=302 /DNA_ORIENTATION=- /assembly_acc=CAM_ASM_000160
MACGAARPGPGAGDGPLVSSGTETRLSTRSSAGLWMLILLQEGISAAIMSSLFYATLSPKSRAASLSRRSPVK